MSHKHNTRINLERRERGRGSGESSGGDAPAAHLVALAAAATLCAAGLALRRCCRRGEILTPTTMWMSSITSLRADEESLAADQPEAALACEPVMKPVRTWHSPASAYGGRGGSAQICETTESAQKTSSIDGSQKRLVKESRTLTAHPSKASAAAASSAGMRGEKAKLPSVPGR